MTQEFVLQPKAVIDASEAAYHAVNAIEFRKSERETGVIGGVEFALTELKDICRPIYPGEICAVLGLSKNGKSFLMKKSIYRETMKLFEIGDPNKVNVFITWEEPPVTLAYSWLAKLSGVSSTRMLKGAVSDVELHNLKNNTVVQVGQYPIYIIGMTSERGSNGRREKIDLSRTGVDRCLDWIMNQQGRDIHMMVLDYLQRIPQSEDRDRKMHVLNCVDWIKDIAMWTDSSVMYATQAKQDVKKYDPPIPGLYDSEWSANAAQSSDHAYSVWMPKNTYQVGEDITVDQYSVNVTEDLQFVSVLKQKGDRDGFILPMEIRPDLLDWRMSRYYYWSNTAKEHNHTLDKNRPFV